MVFRTRCRLLLRRVVAYGGVAALGAGVGHAQQSRATPRDRSSGEVPALTVDGQVALHSLASLSDDHLQKLADMLAMLAATDAARSGDWTRIRAPLAEAALRNVPAVHWFALRNGTYWTVERGRASAGLSDRPYFPRLLAGQTVLGELVVSRSSSRNTAIVAVPVRGRDGSVIGALGSSVHLDSLGALLRREMGGLSDQVIFFAIDATPLGALNSDPNLIFTEPMKLGDEGMRKAFTEILAGRDGLVTYDFRGSRRTVLYHKSPVTHWWYGFGVIEPRADSRRDDDNAGRSSEDQPDIRARP